MFGSCVDFSKISDYMMCLKLSDKTIRTIYSMNSRLMSLVIGTYSYLSGYWYLPYRKTSFNGIYISLMANSLNSNSNYYDICRNLSMIAYTIEIQKIKFTNK